MSKKSRTFAADMKKAYQIPNTEIIKMDFPILMIDTSYHDGGIPKEAPAHHVGGGGGTSQPF